jgi:metal transporter CNNM
MLVGAVMTPIDKTFMLNVDERLNFECIARIFKTGYSRIPVYEVR